MILGGLILGALSGAGSAVATLLLGGTPWIAFAAYTAVGSLVTLASLTLRSEVGD